MPSKLKSDTARANGAKSRGPKSPATLEISSRNAVKHGFTSRNSTVLACENPAEFQDALNEYVAAFQPANAVEQDFVDQMVDARWRMRRLKIVEIALVDHEMERLKPELIKKFIDLDHGIHLGLAFRALADDSRVLSLISRYTSRLSRMHDKAYQTLSQLQQGRKSQQSTPEPQPEPEPANPLTLKPQLTLCPPKEKAPNEPTTGRRPATPAILAPENRDRSRPLSEPRR